MPVHPYLIPALIFAWRGFMHRTLAGRMLWPNALRPAAYRGKHWTGVRVSREIMLRSNENKHSASFRLAW